MCYGKNALTVMIMTVGRACGVRPKHVVGRRKKYKLFFYITANEAVEEKVFDVYTNNPFQVISGQ